MRRKSQPGGGMPTGVRKTLVLPKTVKIDYVKGEAFIRLRDAAKLAGIPAPVLEMGQRLLKSGNTEGATFVLGTPELQAKANEIAQVFKSGLRKVGKVFGGGAPMVPKVWCDGEKIVCWYQERGVTKGK